MIPMETSPTPARRLFPSRPTSIRYKSLTQEIGTTSSLKEDTERLDSQRGAKAPRADANKGRTGRMTAKMILRMSEQAIWISHVHMQRPNETMIGELKVQ